jgi:putative transposase
MLMYRLHKEEGARTEADQAGWEAQGSAVSRGTVQGHSPGSAWRMDFVADQSHHSTRFRALTIVDVYTRDRSRTESEGR